MTEYLDAALEAAKKAEDVILRNFRPDLALTLKEDETPVTIADVESEKIIRDAILSRFPTHSILGEEYGGLTENAEYLWIIDPIDGTKNYSRNIPIFGTQIALMKEGEIILGVSNIPAMKELMYAEKGQGAFLNGNRVHVSTVSDLNEAFMAFGSVSLFDKNGLLGRLVTLGNLTRGHRNFGDSWMYHLLAQGKVDFVMEASVKIWDVAAAGAIVSEAGGIATDMAGKKLDLDTSSTLFANQNIHEKVRHILNE